MNVSRRSFFGTVGGLAAARLAIARQGAPGVTRFVRYRHQGRTLYGILRGSEVHEIEGGLFGTRRERGTRVPLSEVKLLWPCEPSKVLAVGLNYRSHLGDRPAPKNPELFFKALTSLVEPEGAIIIPPGARNVHFEGELVVVIGKKASRISVAEANTAIFGVTCGNDVSERDWQRGDLQWWRAKGADTFGPLGPSIAAGLDFTKSRLQTRVNGEVKQSQLISDLLFDVPTVVSFASQFVTLLPGDVIYTGTPGSTTAMKPGDVVEVEIEGIGILRNRVVG